MKWRAEYTLNEAVSFLPKRWRLFVDTIKEPIDVGSLDDAAGLIPADSDAWEFLEYLMKDTRDGVELLPWSPFAAGPSVTKCLGEDGVARVQAKPFAFKVWNDDGWVWCHQPGDAAS